MQGLGFGLVAQMLDPNYRTPRSLEMNIGMQREIYSGIIFSADFVRNVGTHYLIGIEITLETFVTSTRLLRFKRSRRRTKRSIAARAPIPTTFNAQLPPAYK
jgi:hypothetical protein